MKPFLSLTSNLQVQTHTHPTAARWCFQNYSYAENTETKGLPRAPQTTNSKLTNPHTHTHASSKRIRDDGAEKHTIPRPSAFICVSTGSYRMIRDRISIIVFHLRYIC